MTMDEFIDGYVARTNAKGGRLIRTEKGFTSEGARYSRVALPCACGDDCPGWAMVPNHPEDIETHNRLYAPRGEGA